MYELSKRFYFDAAHTLRRDIDTESSLRIHGHSYRAEVTIRGKPDAGSGMIVDLGLLERKLQEARDALDHRFLDEMNDLGPATMENLCAWIWKKLSEDIGNLSRVSVFRDSSGDGCAYYGEDFPA